MFASPGWPQIRRMPGPPLWPGYSHCCFTSQQDLDPTLAAEIESAFISVTADDPVGKAVLDGEACNNFVPGMDSGWEMIEKAALAEGLI